jgi:hypothetical protein
MTLGVQSLQGALFLQATKQSQLMIHSLSKSYFNTVATRGESPS